MADLAVLGIEARSDSVVKAASDLDRLAVSAGRAEGQVENFNQAAGQTPAQAQAITRASAATQMAMNAQASAARAMANSNRLAGHQIGNLSAQVADIGVSLASGMNPFLVMLQQGSQIIGVFGPGTGVTGILKGMGQTIISLARQFLPVIAVATLLGAALGTVKDDAQRMTSATVGWGHMVQGAFAEAGARIYDQFKPAIDFIGWGMSELGKIVIWLGNLIINSFRAAYEDIKFVFSNLPDILEAAMIGAVNAVIRRVNEMVVSAANGVNYLIGIMNNIPGVDINTVSTNAPLNEIENKAASDLAKAAARHNENIARIMGEDPVGGFLQGAARRAAGFAEADAAKNAKKGRGGKSEPDRYKEIVEAQKQRIEELKLEAQTLFMTEEAASRLRIEQELLNKAANDNISLTLKQTEELKKLAEQTAAAEANTKALKDAFDFAKDVTGGFFADLKNGLMNGKSLWESFGDAAMNVLNKILDKMLEMAVNSLFTSGTGGAGGFLSSLFGSLFGLGGGIGMRANGGPVSANTPYVVGERGPELFVPTGAGRIVPNHAMPTGARETVTLNYAPTINAQGADPAQLDRVRAELQAQKRDFGKMVDQRLYARDRRAVRA